ncbi:MAG: DUF4123 domain-containing protein [Planctomycetes bacterium]|nr:DUF4123 domain-containing protein [Planctomycetota bacterium]
MPHLSIDAARCPEGPEQAKRAQLRHQSLLAGPLGQELGEVAPYLIEFRAGSSFGEWWFEQWGRSVGVLVEAPVSLEELRSHFRTLLIVRHQDGRKYFFRFYDPRVLRLFLPNCSANEIRRFFGPITAFHCEGAEGKELLSYRSERAGLTIKESPVAVPGMSASPSGPGPGFV